MRVRREQEAQIRRLAGKLLADVHADGLNRGIEVGIDRMTGGVRHDFAILGVVGSFARPRLAPRFYSLSDRPTIPPAILVLKGAPTKFCVGRVNVAASLPRGRATEIDL